jgi:hypothetical protein
MPRPTSSAIVWRKTLLPSKLSHESRADPSNALEIVMPPHRSQQLLPLTKQWQN